MRAPLLALLLVACADEGSTDLLDLRGPEGRVLTSGPWTVEVLSEVPPTLHVAVDPDDVYAASPLTALGADRYAGEIAAAPLGTRVRYYVSAGGERLPAATPRVFEVVSLFEPDAAPEPGAPCRMSFRFPSEDALLSAADDSAPQAGLQVTVVVATDLDDGTHARLGVGERGYVAAAEGGVAAFAPVDLEPGGHTLVAEGRRVNGPPCAAEVNVRVAARP